MKTCVDCGVDKPLDQYTLSTKRAGGKKYPRSRCKECTRIKARHYARSSKYGVSEQKFNEMLAAQGGRCPICGTSDPRGRNWAVDHDHSCCPGKRSCGECVRALLCNPCNLGLGSFDDNVDALRAAADYIQQFKGQATMAAQTRRQSPI